MNQIANTVKCLVPMSEVVKRYGFQPNRAGFISCPFHPEKTASLKIFPNNRGWHCFGCNAGGSVIDFVEKLFSVGFMDAIRIIDRDFGLGLLEEKTLTQHRRNQKELERIRQEAEAKKAQLKALDDWYWKVFDLWKECDDAIRLYKPKNPGDEWDERYVAALHKLPYVEAILEQIEKEREVVRLAERGGNQVLRQ